MAAELEQKLDAEVQISPSTGGVFEVEDHGVLIFSKKQLGRFPHEGEIMSIVQKGVANNQPSDSSASAQEKEKTAPTSQPISVKSWLTNHLKGLSRD